MNTSRRPDAANLWWAPGLTPDRAARPISCECVCQGLGHHAVLQQLWDVTCCFCVCTCLVRTQGEKGTNIPWLLGFFFVFSGWVNWEGAGTPSSVQSAACAVCKQGVCVSVSLCQAEHTARGCAVLFYLTWHVFTLPHSTLHLGPALPCPAPCSTTCMYPSSKPDFYCEGAWEGFSVQ